MLYKKEECPYFLITHNEKEMLQKLRSLGDEDRNIQKVSRNGSEMRDRKTVKGNILTEKTPPCRKIYFLAAGRSFIFTLFCFWFRRLKMRLNFHTQYPKGVFLW